MEQNPMEQAKAAMDRGDYRPAVLGAIDQALVASGLFPFVQPVAPAADEPFVDQDDPYIIILPPFGDKHYAITVKELDT